MSFLIDPIFPCWVGAVPETFILSGMPLLEEAHRFGEKVLPRFDADREVSMARNYTWSTLSDRDLSTVKST